MKTFKKLLSVLLVAVILLGVSSPIRFSEMDFFSIVASAAEVKSVDSIKIISLPNKIKYYVDIDATKNTYIDYKYDEYGNSTEIEYEYYNCWTDTDGMKIEIAYDDGQTMITDASYVYVGNDDTWHSFNIYQQADNGNYNEWHLGENTINVEFMGKTTSFMVTLLENPILNVEFTKLNLKDSYMKNEFFNIYGSEIKVSYKDGQSENFIIDDYYESISLESKVLNGNYYCYYSVDEEASKAVFSCFNFTFEIPFQRNDVSVVCLDFVNEAVSYNAVGSDVILKYSNGTSQTAKILDFNTRAGGSEDCIFEEGYVSTTVGVFDGWFAIYNFCNLENSTYKFGIGNHDINDENAYESSTSEKAVFCYLSKELAIYSCYYSWAYNYSLDSEIYYDGEINENNFDLLLFISNFILGDFERNTFNKDDVNVLISSIFDEDEIDLKLSKYYDKESEEVILPQFYGAGGVFSNEIKAEKINGIVYVEIELLVGDNESVTYYFDYRNNRCTYFGSVENKNSKSELNSGVYSVKVDDISLDYKGYSALVPEITADEGAEYATTYFSDSKNVTVDENGKIYAAKKGTANITVTVTDSQGNVVTDTCKVEVKYTWWQWIIKIVLFGWIWY